MNLNLQGKVVFVAGSSRGIGFSIAETFLQEGSKVVLTGRKIEDLQQARSRLTKYSDSQIFSFVGDLCQREVVVDALNQAFEYFGQIDAVVANIGKGAGVLGWEVSKDEWLQSLEINFLCSMLLSEVALRYLENGQNPSITYISSIVACESLHAPLAYSASKAALQSAVKNLSRLLGPKGIRANIVAPGNILFAGGSWEKKLKQSPDDCNKYIQQEVPLQRFGTPEEIASMVVFLASAKAAFVTGSCVVVDGGQTRSL